MSKILIINAGSSSIKWSLFNEKMNVEAKGVAQRIKLEMGILTLDYLDNKTDTHTPLPSFLETVKKIVKQWEDNGIVKNYDEITQVAFRIVNGGPHMQNTCEVNEQNIQYLRDSIDLAPVHNPGALEAVLAFKQLLPHAKMTMHFDTSFHRTLPKSAYIYPINHKLTEELNIRKYGFHGLNHNFIAEKSKELFGKENVNVISLHIGNGASLCAIENGKSIDTSMGFTPIAGVMMGTRSGDIDTSIIPYIMKKTGKSIDEVFKILNEESGMLGVSGVSSDIRDIHGVFDSNEQARFALELYCLKISDYLIKYLNRINGKIDGIIFTAGVGENDDYVREQVIKNIHLLDLKIDDVKNKDRKYGDYKLISTPDSQLPIYVVRAQEELFIANEAKNFFKK
ncbi:acetate kinase [Metamycoplasma cloacale]|uniref:Acetate kinase n=1 Tax=Metamycoplasma cloacale TaxID=92401 RepID=A0A2Z4LMJ9_9BACT|nr:acetate/propionate family kinase [Metamycoplasma cloacale]AWX42658.1 acetate/propionate family kinase [Metamycoplasma cloacale]VEU79539.1 acetate kinase [Metamycoplasma cloacale]